MPTYHLTIPIPKPVLHIEVNRLNSSYCMGVLNLFQPEIKGKKAIQSNKRREVTLIKERVIIDENCNTFKLEVH